MKCPKCGKEGIVMETEDKVITWCCGDCIGFWEEVID
jgi:ribosomal protein S27AE